MEFSISKEEKRKAAAAFNEILPAARIHFLSL
jgi:hypothetical protein